MMMMMMMMMMMIMKKKKKKVVKEKERTKKLKTKNLTNVHKSRDSSVGIALDYGLDDRSSRVRFPAGG
jgi:hypothetical protein